MVAGRPATRRSLLLVAAAGVCIVLVAAAAIGSGFLGGAGSRPLPSAAPAAIVIPSGTFGADCVARLDPYIAQLDELRKKVSPDLELATYEQLITAASKARESLAVKGLEPSCVAVLGIAQAALSDYTVAYYTWLDCTKTTACTLDSIRDPLAQRWAAAAANLDRVAQALP